MSIRRLRDDPDATLTDGVEERPPSPDNDDMVFMTPDNSPIRYDRGSPPYAAPHALSATPDHDDPLFRTPENNERMPDTSSMPREPVSAPNFDPYAAPHALSATPDHDDPLFRTPENNERMPDTSSMPREPVFAPHFDPYDMSTPPTRPPSSLHADVPMVVCTQSEVRLF